MIGQVLKGIYRIYDQVGAGGFATVYLGRNLTNNTVVAIKVLKQEYTAEPRFVERFRREAEMAHRLQHPNVVRMLDYGVEGGTHFLVMEYVEGKTLSDIIAARGALPIQEAVGIADQIAQALDAAWRAGIVHRDIKPHNIMVTPDGQVKVMDFGIARMSAMVSLTQSGMFMGTPRYLSPEMARGEKTDIRSDLYALGLVLYEMLTGDAPFTADSPWALLRQQIETPPPPLKSRRPDIPDWLEAVIATALAKDPARRFQTPAEMLAALRRPEGKPPVSGRVVQTPVPPAPPRRHSLWPVMAGVLVALLIVGTVLLLALNPGWIPHLWPTAEQQEVAARGGITSTPTATPTLLSTQTPTLTNPPLAVVVTATPSPTPLIVVVTATPSPTPLVVVVTPTPSPAPPATATPTPAATTTPQPTAAATRRPTPGSSPQPATPGLITDFEQPGTWKRGDEPNGTLTQSGERVHEGTYAGKLSYNFGTTGNDYVVFLQTHPIAGQPTRLTAWVYGDGSGHFLNAWIKDRGGQVWQVPLGRVTHTGWQQMIGFLDTNQAWPWSHISGPDNGAIDYPVSFLALVLDDFPDSFTGNGTLYIDDLRADSEAASVPGGGSGPAGGPTPTARAAASPPPAGSLTGNIAFAVYNAGIGSYTLYTVRPDGSGLHALADYVHQPDYSPDGTRIVVDGVGGGKNDLWSFKYDGSNWQQWTRHPDDHFPTWSVNGQTIVFSSPRQGDGVYRLYMGDSLVGTDKTKFIIGDYPVLLPNWEIVFNGCDYGWGTGARCGLWRVSRGYAPVRLTDNPQDIPTDGTAEDLLFLRPDGNNWDIYRAVLKTGSIVRLTDNPGRDGPAAFSPDGKTIAFLSDRSGSWALYTMNRQGEEVQKRLDLPLGGQYDAAPEPWTSQRISWGPPPAGPAPRPTEVGGNLLPAPTIRFPIPDDVVSASRATTVRWTWSQQLAANQGFEVRFWHTTDPSPMGVAPPTTATELTIHFGLTEAYRQHGENTWYYLDVVVVQIDPYRVLSRSAPIRVKADPNK